MLTESEAPWWEHPAAAWEPLMLYLHHLTGITIPPQKADMVRSRLRRQLVRLRPSNCAHFEALLRQNEQERQTFINLLTTNETSFFRTERIWKYFSRIFLPEFTQHPAERTLRAWSAAASTGEEALSIAICCQEHRQSHPGFRYQILATDVNTEVLEQARSGIFSARSAQRLREAHPDWLSRYLRPGPEDRVQADAELLLHTRFLQHNLMHPAQPMGEHDIVFLRNALIYFRPTEQARILHHVSTIMAPGAILVLGESESIATLDVPFQFVEPQVYSRRPA